MVSCGARWTDGVVGFGVRVVSESASPAKLLARLDAFLETFRGELARMDGAEFREHAAALAARKLEPATTLEDAAADEWEHLAHRWREPAGVAVARADAAMLARVTPAMVRAAYDSWLCPKSGGAQQQRARAAGRVVVSVVGAASAHAADAPGVGEPPRVRACRSGAPAKLSTELAGDVKDGQPEVALLGWERHPCLVSGANERE